MSHSRRAGANEPVIDDFPVRPDAINQNERTPNKLKGHHRTLVLFSLIYFLYGSGISIYALLYPEQARSSGVSSIVYGSVIATSHLVSILLYPVACRIVTNVSSRNSLSVSVFVIGVCRILFGMLNLISDEESFIAVSYAVQFVEGFGMSILTASTVVIAGTQEKGQIWKLALTIQSSLCLGLILGPIAGQIAKEELGFDVPFYIIGGLTALSFILIATLLQEPEHQVTYTDIPIIYWMNDKRMLIYFFIVFATFNYVGFLSVSLEHLIRKFHLSSLYFSTVFSISPFVFGLTFPGWSWLIKKGFNNVMLVFLGTIATFASLVLLGPAPFTKLKASLTYVCCALVLEGLGIACKSACVIDASEKDLRHHTKHTVIQQNLIVAAVFILGASFGYFCGSLTTGFTDYYIGYKRATFPLFALEICTAIGSVIFAMSRDYVSKNRREASGENQPILNS